MKDYLIFRSLLPKYEFHAVGCNRVTNAMYKLIDEWSNLLEHDELFIFLSDNLSEVFTSCIQLKSIKYSLVILENDHIRPLSLYEGSTNDIIVANLPTFLQSLSNKGGIDLLTIQEATQLTLPNKELKHYRCINLYDPQADKLYHKRLKK